MACELMYKPRQTPLQRQREVAEARAKLLRLLAAGTVRVVIAKAGTPNAGAISFVGWTAEDRDGVSDACAYRVLRNTPEMRAAVLRAEGLAGTKVNERLVASGVHSHDGGKTWGPGH